MAGAEMNDEERALLEYRNSANFRSVKRADPHVKEILDTSVYSVIYNYDEASGSGAGKWEKQKQEGPLFVVRRDTSPEWSLFMLNRQGLKNPAIPLIPGEMKLTVIDQGMLQVARRGDKIRLGVWFSEGPEAVERFKQSIFSICGEPSKRPDLPNMMSSPAASAPQPAQAQSEDGLSRLFAGLMKSPPVQSPPVQPAVLTPPIQTTTITSTTVSSAHPPVLAANTSHHSPSPIPVPPASERTSRTQLPVSPPPPPPQMASPPGQTADDLLMSILGLAPPSLPPPPPPPPQNHASPQPPHLQNGHGTPQNMPPAPYPPVPGIHQQQIHQFPLQHNQPYPPAPPSHPSQNSPLQQNRSTPPPHPHQQFVNPPSQDQFPPQPQSHQQQRYSKVGDASFAQTAAMPSPIPGHANVNATTSSMSTSPAISFHTPGTGSPSNGYKSNAESRNIMAEAVVDGLQRKELQGMNMAGSGMSAEERKEEFKRRVTDLMLSDSSFMNEVWERYLDRMSRVAQGG
ncbi:uncharacterized protein I303_102095 [Kwoniella dejecticola CBS 10117]|uniref:mRNA-decapping enzyme C-terminal domain-containing protein n=1 Tax=Kwoniella dejecticola CBS 10117 TaxID=1296121 RepID=A0A1A6ABW2_9TREE|nr:uncharacterized protein I303_01764 [Kwoniella dejecticola CBS 10117]OBR87556.1 hypothetical protein I303_01764 [Kwoniella dejecticola CBS 10117]